MAFENAIDIGFFGVDFSVGYTADSSKVYSDSVIIEETVDEFSVSYVANVSKIFSEAFLIEQSVDEFSDIYVKTELDKIYTDSVPIYASSLPAILGDTGQIIVIGAFCDFEWEIVETVPYKLQFTDWSSGDVVGWYWDFGDGSLISNDQNPLHKFAPGTYNVRLDVQFGYGSWAFKESTIFLPEVDVELYLVKNSMDGSSIANSVVLINENELATFFTTNNTPSNDKINNLMTYNYGYDDLDIGNIPSNVFSSMKNTDPKLTNITGFDWDSDSVSLIMSKTFLPEALSPVFDKGDNSFVLGVETDIIGNPRRYLFGNVDIGPYELQINQLYFSTDKIQSIFQDKLRFDRYNQRFVPVVGDDIYTDLWSQFDNNPEYREEFVRESNIIIKLKSLTSNIKFSSDKKNVELARFEAYFDLKTKSIIFSKSNEYLGAMLSTIFDDGRYVFYFNEIEHILIVYINPTYNMGKSGKGNIVNEVRSGGSAIINR